MADPVVFYEVDDKVSVITLNRPEKLNAISAELLHQLLDAFRRADAEPATSVVLLRAEGRSFCAGYDIGAKAPEAGDWRSDPIKAHKHLAAQLDFEMTPWNLKKPVIASVQGHVMGGGCELVMFNRVVPLAELRAASLAWAKRLALVSPEALYATKLAINRGVDAAGFTNRIHIGLDVVAPLYATKTEFGERFRQIVAAEGVPAAVRWRAAQFKE